MRLDKSHNPPRIRLDRSHNPTVARIDLGTGSGVRPVHKLAKFLTKTNSKVHEPKTYNEAIDNLIHGNQWREAIDKELWNLDSYQILCYKELLSGKKTIKYKWIFKVKYKPNRIIERYKAQLVAQRFSQVFGVDFTETFAPTIRREFLRIFLALATLLGLVLIQIDIIDAYLESVLRENK